MTSNLNRFLTHGYPPGTNLPKEIIHPQGVIRNYYTAGGEKTGKKLFDPRGTLLYHEQYYGDLVVKNGLPSHILHADGVINLSSRGVEYNCHLKDHLGNVRVVIAPDENLQPNVLQVNDYYPFGMVHTTDAGANKYLYNGKEEQEMPGKWLDYGARFYGPDGSRFFTVDPLAEKFPWQSPYCYAGNNPIRFIDYNGLGPGDRVKAARSMTRIEYKQESVSSMRTANTAEARQYMDCAELVCRVLGAYQITDGVQHMSSSGLKSFLDKEDQFIHSTNPQVGDIALWEGHVDVVTVVGEDGKIKLTHARGEKKLSIENPEAISPEQYRKSEFYGYYRPVIETPDGKIDKNGNPITTNNQYTNSPGSFDFAPQPQSAVQVNTRVVNNSYIQQINNLPEGKYKIVNGKIVPQ